MEGVRRGGGYAKRAAKDGGDRSSCALQGFSWQSWQLCQHKSKGMKCWRAFTCALAALEGRDEMRGWREGRQGGNCQEGRQRMG